MKKRREYDKTDIETMQAALKALPKKERTQERLTAPDVVKIMRAEIRAALARGYTLDEIVQALNDRGNFDLKVPTVRRYLTDVLKTKKKGKSNAIFGRFGNKNLGESLGSSVGNTGDVSRAVELPSAEDL
jgi:hypothetical protein